MVNYDPEDVIDHWNDFSVPDEATFSRASQLFQHLDFDLDMEDGDDSSLPSYLEVLGQMDEDEVKAAVAQAYLHLHDQGGTA